MKNIVLLFVSFCLFFIACDNKKAEKVVKTKQLLVLVYDISLSNDSYALLGKEHFNSIYTHLGYNGGGKIYGLHIQSNSTKQEPYTATVNSLDTLETKGSRNQLGKIKKRNVTTKGVFEEGREVFVNNSVTAMIKGKTEKFSDIQNAMILAKQIIEMPQYAQWNKRILVVSDMLNDFPPQDGVDAMKPMKFQPTIKVGVVRASNSVQLSKLFSEITVTNYTTIEDGIRTMLNK